MKRGIKTMLVGAALIVMGVLGAVAVFLPLIRGGATEVQYRVPGSFDVSVEEAGRYYFWDNHRTLFEGTSYNREARLPDGMTIEIRDSSGGRCDFVADSSISWSVGNHSKESVGYIDMDAAGTVQVDVSGGGEERILSFSQSSLLQVMGRVFIGLGFAGLMGVLGFGVLIWGVVKLVRSSS